MPPAIAPKSQTEALRRAFLISLIIQLRVLWPIFSGHPVPIVVNRFCHRKDRRLAASTKRFTLPLSLHLRSATEIFHRIISP